MVTGLPSEGLRMLLDESMRMRASASASGLSGRWTAIWSPSKSALNAEHTYGCSRMALPSTRWGSEAGTQRQVHGQLVTVEVGVERRAHERVQLDGLALDQLGFEGLDAQTVQGRCAVEQHRVLGDDLFEDVPHLRVLALDHPLGRLDVL